MTTQLLVVLSNPSGAQEDEYNEWYTNQHLGEVLRIPGFVSARRFKLAGPQLTGFQPSSHGYLALYEIEGDLDAALTALQEKVESGEIALPSVIDMVSIAPWAFASIAEGRP